MGVGLKVFSSALSRSLVFVYFKHIRQAFDGGMA